MIHLVIIDKSLALYLSEIEIFVVDVFNVKIEIYSNRSVSWDVYHKGANIIKKSWRLSPTSLKTFVLLRQTRQILGEWQLAVYENNF